MNIKKLSTMEEIRIYSDPYRLKILTTFQKLNRPATIKEVADEMGEVPAKVYYHAKKMERIGLLLLEHTKLINGITAKYYLPFDGEIHIHREEVEGATEQVIASETQKLLGELYDKSRARFLESLQPNTSAKLMNHEVYLTEEEAAAFINYVNDFMNKHQHKTADDQTAHELFITMTGSKGSPASQKT